jgi:tetratricopeptide (TPR) repeat protein
MSEFHIILIGVVGFFAYKIYEHVQGIDPDTPLGHEQQEEQSQTVQAANNHLPSIDTTKIQNNADRAFENGDFETAKSLLESLILHSPKDPEVLNRLAYIQAKDDEPQKAIGNYLKSLSINPDDDLVHSAVASLFKMQHDYEIAQDHYLKALDIDSEYEITYYNYANLLIDMQREDDAKVMYTKALEINPEFDEAQIELDKLA